MVSINLPPSKSISNRLLILNALSNSPNKIENLSDCDDTKVLLQALNSIDNQFDIGASGSAMRFLTAYLSIKSGEWILTGNDRMKQRPIGILADAIKNLGGRIEYIDKEGFPPLKIFGNKLNGGEIELSGDVSSQYLSALLMIAPTMRKELTIYLKGKITSEPYIRMTLALMKKFGIDFIWKGNKIRITPSDYKPVPAKVESDWSAASYWYEMMALSNSKSVIYLNGLEECSLQGDSIVFDLFKQFGVQSDFTSQGLRLEKRGNILKNFNYDFANNPDLAQTFAVTCAFLDIPFQFTGLHTLKIKETDRISALVNELRKFGFNIKSNNLDNLWWDGSKTEKQSNICVQTYNDHRMAMAFAPAMLKTEPFEIENREVVSKSYPGYWREWLVVSRSP